MPSRGHPKHAPEEDSGLKVDAASLSVDTHTNPGDGLKCVDAHKSEFMERDSSQKD